MRPGHFLSAWFGDVVPTGPEQHQEGSGRLGEVFVAFLLLGLTSFGGPVAHLGYFREAFVVRRRWLSEAGYAELVALCQFLPGPASSQVGIAIGLLRAGHAGAVVAWIAFTLPRCCCCSPLPMASMPLAGRQRQAHCPG